FVNIASFRIAHCGYPVVFLSLDVHSWDSSCPSLHMVFVVAALVFNRVELAVHVAIHFLEVIVVHADAGLFQSMNRGVDLLLGQHYYRLVFWFVCGHSLTPSESVEA